MDQFNDEFKKIRDSSNKNNVFLISKKYNSIVNKVDIDIPIVDINQIGNIKDQEIIKKAI